ncbi:MAG: hypothetical protein GY870_12345, partial [archaeon]|nr:hypothetical protein [archaeon]
IISNQTFDLSITLNQIDDAILKIPFNASELTISYYSNGTIRPHHFYNITSDDIPEGVNCPYELIEQIQIGFGLILEDPNQRIYSASTGGGTWEDARSLNSENYADFGLIQMEEDLLYNFTLSTTGTGNTSLTLFKNTDLTLNTTNSANVIAKITNEDSKTRNHFTYHCEEGGEYFILIQKETMHTQSVDYDFTYRNCPRNMTLSSPTNGKIYAWNYGQQNTVDLEWQRDPMEQGDTSIDHIIQISNTSSFLPEGTTELLRSGLTGGLVFLNYECLPEKWYYWRVKGKNRNNFGYYDGYFRFAFDNSKPQAPEFDFQGNNEINVDYNEFHLNWTVPDDYNSTYSTNLTAAHGSTIDHYNLYRSTDSNFDPTDPVIASETLVISGLDQFTTRLLTHEDEVDQNGRYYYYLEAVDKGGHVSDLSDLLTVTVSYGGVVDAKWQDFQVQEGDALYYTLTSVKSDQKEPNTQRELMTYKGNMYEAGTIFSFIPTIIDNRDIFSVQGAFWAKGSDTDDDWDEINPISPISLVPYITNNNVTYQEAVFDLYTKQILNERNPNRYVFTHQELLRDTSKIYIESGSGYSGTWTQGLVVRNVICYTYSEYYIPEDKDQTSITYIVDVDSGVLVEMIYYERGVEENENAYGYNLLLTDFSADHLLSVSIWSYGPILIPLFIGVVVAAMYALSKKVEL